MMHKLGERLYICGPNIDRNNQLFAFTLTICMGILGSISSIMIALAFAFVVFLQIIKYVHPPKNREIWLVAFFFVFFFAAGVFQSLVHFDDGENLKIIIKRLPFLAIIPLVTILYYSRKSDIETHLESGAAIGAFLAALYTIYEIQAGSYRTEVGSGNPGPFATTLSLALTLCLIGLLRSNDNRRTAYMLIGVCSATLCVFSSGVRTLWPLLIVLPIITLWGSGKYRTIAFNRYYLAGALIFAILVFALLGDLISLRLQFLFRSLNQVFVNGVYQNSLGTRLLMWEYSWTVIPDSFWFGVGNSQAISGLTEFLKENQNISAKYSHFHNFIVNAVVRGGIIELGATLGLLIGPIAVVWRYRKIESCRYGVTLMLATSTIIASSGMLNIAFGHDIHDSLFTYFMAIGTWIVLGKENIEMVSGPDDPV